MTIFNEDLTNFASAEFLPWEKMRGKTFFVTGATGLIGATFIKALLFANKKRSLGITIYALVRAKEKAARVFDGIADETLQFVYGSVENFPAAPTDATAATIGNIDYIVHGASPTSSKMFVEKPVEILGTAYEGTKALLEFAKEKQVKGFLYLSSMEVYGYPAKGHKVIEEDAGAIATLDVRNSYPGGKQVCEALCAAYAKEYAVPTRILRLTQTFGPGIEKNDGRIFAYFARCMENGEDIVLKTAGETERCYLYTMDAATAILTALINGEDGKAYNAANENTYCSIAEMAETVARDANIKVRFDIQDAAANGFLQTLYMDLSTEKLKGLGWQPLGGEAGYDISAMYARMIAGSY